MRYHAPELYYKAGRGPADMFLLFPRRGEGSSFLRLLLIFGFGAEKNKKGGRLAALLFLRLSYFRENRKNEDTQHCGPGKFSGALFQERSPLFLMEVSVFLRTCSRPPRARTWPGPECCSAADTLRAAPGGG